MDLASPSSMSYIVLIPMLIYVLILGLGIYIAVLVIKALKIYIKNNS